MEKTLVISLIITLTGLFIVLICYLFRSRTAMKKLVAQEAFFFHQDLGNKIEALEEDATMTSKDWEKMLEIAKFADERFLYKCPELIPEFQSLAEVVEEIIEDRKIY